MHDGFLCARDNCGLPLYVSSVSDDDQRLRLWHVHATAPDPAGDPARIVLDLKAWGRNGCEAPLTIHPGTPWSDVKPEDKQAPTRL